jgi:hypothetical protein
MSKTDLVEAADGGEAEGGLRGAEEQLQHADRRRELASRDVCEVDDGTSSLVHHHLGG